MLSNQFKIFVMDLLVIFCCCFIAIARAGKFDAKRDVSYEMYCRRSNQSTATTLHDLDQALYDIEQNVLLNENLVVNGESENKTVTGVQNCRWNWNPHRPTRMFIHGYYSVNET